MKKIILWLSVSVALLAAAMFAVVKKMPYFSPSAKAPAISFMPVPTN